MAGDSGLDSLLPLPPPRQRQEGNDATTIEKKEKESKQSYSWWREKQFQV